MLYSGDSSLNQILYKEYLFTNQTMATLVFEVLNAAHGFTVDLLCRAGLCSIVCHRVRL